MYILLIIRVVEHSNGEETEIPSMFSFSSSLGLFSGKLAAKMEDSNWSKAFTVEAVGTNGIIQMKDSRKKLLYELGVSLYLGKAPVCRTLFLFDLLFKNWNGKFHFPFQFLNRRSKRKNNHTLVFFIDSTLRHGFVFLFRSSI